MAKKTAKRTSTVAPFKVPSPRLSRYLYVEVRGWFRESDFGDETVLDGPVSFMHAIVRAKSEEAARNLGAAHLDTRKVENPTEGFNHFDGAFLNNYVVKL